MIPSPCEEYLFIWRCEYCRRYNSTYEECDLIVDMSWIKYFEFWYKVYCLYGYVVICTIGNAMEYSQPKAAKPSEAVYDLKGM